MNQKNKMFKHALQIDRSATCNCTCVRIIWSQQHLVMYFISDCMFREILSLIKTLKVSNITDSQSYVNFSDARRATTLDLINYHVKH